MTRHSLRLRLMLAQAATITIALVLAGIGLTLLFERHLERRVDEELATYARQLASRLVVAPDGSLRLLADLADPRFEVPLSGLYWQVASVPDGTLLRSRSLWDHVLDLPADPLPPGSVHRHDLPGPGSTELFVHERPLILGRGTGGRHVRVATAVDRASIEAARAAFAGQLALALALLAVVLIAAGLAQVWFGLRPFERLRRAVGLVRARRSDRLVGNYPDEIRPLVDEVNALLEAQSAIIARARAQAADLAHGLKTPLTVLRAEAAKLEARGDAATAADLDRLARDMQRHIDRDLARARLAATTRSNDATALAEVTQRLVQTLERTPRGGRLEWSVAVDDTLDVAVDPDDLAELLGSILDNAAKWAREIVSIEAAVEDGKVTLVIADDGLGVPAGDRERLGTRGVRLDATTPGHGIGLAIARDIVEAYGGTLAFAEAPGGGLAVRLDLPAAQASIGQVSMR
jgi:signal transduction histidine kinase